MHDVTTGEVRRTGNRKEAFTVPYKTPTMVTQEQPINSKRLAVLIYALIDDDAGVCASKLSDNDAETLHEIYLNFEQCKREAPLIAALWTSKTALRIIQGIPFDAFVGAIARRIFMLSGADAGRSGDTEIIMLSDILNRYSRCYDVVCSDLQVEEDSIRKEAMSD